MSLVAYGASDDDADSDSNEFENEAEEKHDRISITAGKTLNNANVSSQSVVSSSETTTSTREQEGAVTSGHISDEEDFEGVSSTSTSSFFSSSVTSLDVLTTHAARKSDANHVDKSTTLEGLPAPQKNEEILEEVDLEEVVKPKDSEIANAPKPPTRKQPVKITIPSLDEMPEDENEKQSSRKVTAASMKKSGLFSLLPAPIHSAKKELHRPLIPHSLGKKAAVGATSTKPSSKHITKESSGRQMDSEVSSKQMSHFNSLTGYDDSDSDDENHKNESSVNFFSLGSTSTLSSTSSSTPSSTAKAASHRLQSGEISSSNSETTNVKQTHSTSGIVSFGSEPLKEMESEPEPVQGSEPGAFNDAPLDFGGRSRHWMHGSQSYLSPVGLSGPMPSDQFTLSSSGATAMSNVASMETDETGGDGAGRSEFLATDDNDLRQFMSDKEFMRLQRKRKRGLEEEINFVEANVDDYVDPSEVAKHLTEETEYVSHKNREDLPTSQQRRKKQITYLAHQAKEKEMELKNTWAQNRMTKKQTQSKYGF